jgi:RHS repeat-associated protein
MRRTSRASRSDTRGASTLSFSYDPEHARTRQVAPDGTTLYLAAFGIQVERFNGASTSQWNNYVYVGGEIVAVFYDKDTGTDLSRFFHKDHLGSIAVITDEAGAVAQRLSYDAWGKRRNLDGTDDTSGVLESTAQTDRGFTGHEHLQEVALIHMNGRIYDPQIGRFMSADPFIQDLMKTQGFNRYSYVDNNPLCYTDPSGYFSFKKLFKNPVVRAVVAIAAAATMQFEVLPALGITNAIASTAISGFTSGLISGGNLKSGLIGAATAVAMYGVGDITAHGKLEFLSDDHLLNIAGHAAVGCASAAAQRGSCSSGALSAAAGSFAGPLIPESLGFTGKLAASAVVGGTASVIGGGKFQNGAITGAFGYLFNEMGNNRQRGYGWTTSDAAANAALLEANPLSITANVEYGGNIYSDGRESYDYTGPITQGIQHGITLYPGDIPAGTNLVGAYHTHSDYTTFGVRLGFSFPFLTGHPDNFSTTDYQTAFRMNRMFPGYKAYLGTPSGQFKVFEPSTLNEYRMR